MHPESEHSLKARLACALKETEDVKALRLKQDAELVALRAEARRLRDILRAMTERHDTEQKHRYGVSRCGCLTCAEARAALAAPAVAAGEDSK